MIPSLRPYYLVASAFLVMTVLLGLGLRWEFVTGWFSSQGIHFPDLRHAHSHAGYYGVLIVALWAGMRLEGLYVFARWGLWSYAAVSAAAVGIFLFQGYIAATIVLSTVVLGYWLLAAWLQIRSRTGATSWLDVAPWNLVIGAAMVVPIALMAGRNPLLSASLAHLFVTVLLLGVFIPASWAALGIARRTSVVFFTIFALGASLHVAFPEESGFLGLVFLGGYGIAVLNIAMRRRLGWVGRLYWLAFAIAIGATVLWEPLIDYRSRIAGIHFVILGPVLTSYVNAFWKVRTWSARLFTGCYHVLLIAMTLSIFRPEWFGVANALELTAWLSTLFVVNLVPTIIFVYLGAQGVAGTTSADTPDSQEDEAQTEPSV